ncbi:hypothetical protein M3Y94_00414300 [Aphelenchoides besseyi]|nr:hypothetical protein M3Y94_00414300 [Aphelenchoides besseyi]KAI6229626.1 hypothetical protein M3Y95_00550700 [Aphelenchoides besseyi]
MDPCELICILSMVMKVPSSADNLACSYCTSVDGLTDDCYKDPVDCWYSSSKYLLYCLTTFEFRSTVALRTRRCIEHSAFPLDLKVLKQIDEHADCSFRSARICNCSSCITPSATRPPTAMERVLNETKPAPEFSLAATFVEDEDYDTESQSSKPTPQRDDTNWFLRAPSWYKSNAQSSTIRSMFFFPPILLLPLFLKHLIV